MQCGGDTCRASAPVVEHRWDCQQGMPLTPMVRNLASHATVVCPDALVMNFCAVLVMSSPPLVMTGPHLPTSQGAQVTGGGLRTG
jgi:hypothetical protein